MVYSEMGEAKKLDSTCSSCCRDGIMVDWRKSGGMVEC